MRYPTLSRSKLEELSLARLSGANFEALPEPEWQGSGGDFDLAGFADAATELERQWEVFKTLEDASDKDLFEGRIGAALHAVLADLPVAVLDDPGFWRYLTYRYFWWFVVWREESAFAEADYGRYRVYVDGNNPSECVLLRAFLRGQICCEESNYLLSIAIPKGADFWRSHVLRVRTATAPVLAREFARSQQKDRMSTKPLRGFARRLNRVWSNVDLHGYDQSEARALIEELRQEPED